MNHELKQIKKLYGEKFSHLCRDLFSTILDYDGLLLKILTEKFAPNHFLYDDIVSHNLTNFFKNYIYNIYCDTLDLSFITGKEKIKETPEELMEMAGYILKECTTEEEIQAYRNYYIKGERLCTFNGGRLTYCRVFFAVKKNALEIKREDFKTPRRQDEYGTSVISIQFTKDGTNTLSIKNRYNHTVDNPDSTFSNNLDNIIVGLTESFENTYGIIQRHKSDNFEIPKYVKANDGRLYKYNYEINNVYYCPNNIIIDNFEIKKFDKEKYIILDYFVLDLTNKKVYLYNDDRNDSFVDSLNDISKINILNEGTNKRIIIVPNSGENIEILINSYNQIIEYKNNNLEEIGDWFMWLNTNLQQFVSSKAKKIGNSFLFSNINLDKIECPMVQKVGYGFLTRNKNLKRIELPNLQDASNGFLAGNNDLEYIYCPNLEKIGGSFLSVNKSLKVFEAPKLKEIGNIFMQINEILEYIYCPNLEKIGYRFLSDNFKLKKLELLNLIEVGDDFLSGNTGLEYINCPNLLKVGNKFLYRNNRIEELELPSLQEIGESFLRHNESLKKFIAQNLQNIKLEFLYFNEALEEIECPKLNDTDAYHCMEEYVYNLFLNNKQKVLNMH